MAEYIKREDAIHAIKKWEYINAEGYKNYVGKNKNVTEIFNTYMTAHRLDIELIEKLPAADVAEVRHGQWIKCDMDIAPHSLHCTKCWWSNHHIQNRQISIMNFCPNCGARMDKGI